VLQKDTVGWSDCTPDSCAIRLTSDAGSSAPLPFANHTALSTFFAPTSVPGVFAAA
jgi:hypothetical protein